MTGQPWEPIADETARAYSAFVVYRELGPTRSLAKVRADWGQITGGLGAIPSTPPSVKSIETWSAQNAWVVRASAYDTHLDRVWTADREARQRAAQKRGADLAESTMNVVEEALKTWTAKEVRPHAAASLLRAALQLQQLSLGGPTESVEVAGKDGRPIRVDVSSLSAQDMFFRSLDLRDEMNRRVDERIEQYKRAMGEDGYERFVRTRGE